MRAVHFGYEKVAATSEIPVVSAKEAIWAETLIISSGVTLSELAFKI